MTREVFVRRETLPVTADEAFGWHERPGAFERLVPPWERIDLVEQTGGVRDGARVVLRMHAGPLRVRWVAEHEGYAAGREFRDVQVEGPFRAWEHTHRVEPRDDGTSVLEDRVEYALPLAPVARLFAGRSMRRRLERTFAYRQRTTRDDLAAHAATKGRTPMQIAVSGASGLVGEALSAFLTTGGHGVRRLVRAATASADSVVWNPDRGTIDAAALGGVDAVVHLAGESIASGRWNDERKRRIRESRVKGTRLVAETIAAMPRRPRVLVCASAVGFYGARGDEGLDESSAPGAGFLAEVCREWEAAADPARAAGIRVVHVRFGVVLSPKGGALAKMLLPFRMGAGGRLGTGAQWMSWISLDDAIGAVHHALTREEVAGPVNAVAPNPVTNAVFTKTLGAVLGRPTIFPMPAFAARLAFGEMADHLLLTGQKVLPRRLLETGYRFRHPSLEGALRHLLGR
jgi:hypothetical protein